MEKRNRLGVVFLGIILSLLVSLSIPEKMFASTKEGTVVTNFNEFKAAIENPNVSAITLGDSIAFESNVILANRDLIINGNADQFFNIDTSIFSIVGKSSSQTHNITLSNLNVISSNNKLEEHPLVKAPLGWNVYAKGITYNGPILADVANGRLTFEGENNLSTFVSKCEC